MDSPVTPSTRPEACEDQHGNGSAHTVQAVDGRFSHVEAEANEAAAALERMLHGHARPSSAEMRAEGGTHHAAAEPETAPAVFGCHSESQAQAPDVDEVALSACRDAADDVDQTLQASSEVEAKYEYQHSFLDPEEALDHAEPKGLQLDPSLEEDSEDPELNAELDAVWESFFPAAEDSQPRLEAVEAAEREGEDVAEVASVDAGQGLAQAEEPVEAPRAADREGGVEGDELAAAPKVALQAADALKAAREEWLKQFDLSSMDPPPPSPADIAARFAVL